MGTSTRIDVRVIAKDGKYLGNDVGGALVTIEDVHTGQLLAQGNTNGGSGVSNLMEISLTRSQVLTVEGASVFSVCLDLEQPILIRVTAQGPLAAQGAANTVSLTQWAYPGKDLTGGPQGGGLLLEIPGLNVRILNPPTHFLPQTAPSQLEIRANVTMMCGCPIGKGHPPWDPKEYEVTAMIQGGAGTTELPLKIDDKAPYDAPSQFHAMWKVPPNGTGQPQIYHITVYAYQRRMANTGVDRTTVIIPAG